MAEGSGGGEAAMPLIPASPQRGLVTSSRVTTSTRGPPDIIVEVPPEEDDDLDEVTEEDKLLFADNKRRGTSLIWNDACLMILHIIQLFAILQSLALRWPFPIEWVRATGWVFLFNFDVWDFVKVINNGTFKEVQGYYTPTTSMPFSYWNILLAWGIFVSLGMFAFTVAYLVITYRKHPFMMIKLAHLQRFYIITAQVISLPLASVIARVFHCTSAGVMEVDNAVPCYADGLHWGYICPSIVAAVAFYVLVPAWMMVRTRAELLNLNTDRHEGYLQLKEVEYVQGLDVLYVVGRFHMFASFRKYGAHLRAGLILLALCVLLVVAFTFNHIFIGAIVLTVGLLIMLVVCLIVRPFRVSCFNFQLCFSYLCLLVFCLLGSLRASFNSFSMASAWLTPTYLNVLLPMIVFVWLGVTVIFIIYLVIRQVGCCLRFCPNPLWPSMTSEDLNKLTPGTRKYIRTIVKCRSLIERSLAMPPMFAPAHELARQIHVMNAFCREAEYLADPIHDTLWDVLDELLEAHSQIAPRSLFAESVKDSIRQTAAELMKLMPNLVRRLAQREYDFILVKPVKRRLLFKMYCMGLFLNGRREKVEKEKMTLPAVQRVYTTRHDDDEFENDDGYYEDMYPEAEEKPLQRPDTALSLGLFSDAALDDELALEEAEEWTRHHPLSAGVDNREFEDDVSAILRDDLSDTVSAMMDGVPGSGSGTHSRLSTAGSARHLYNRLVVIDGQSPGSPVSGARPSSRLAVTAASPQTVDRLSSGGSSNATTTPPQTTTGILPPPPPPGGPAAPAQGSVSVGATAAGAGSRPGSGRPASGSRPGSANVAAAQVAEEEQWRQSPLPGQIHSEDNTKGEQVMGQVHSLSSGAPGQSVV